MYCIGLERQYRVLVLYWVSNTLQFFWYVWPDPIQYKEKNLCSGGSIPLQYIMYWKGIGGINPPTQYIVPKNCVLEKPIHANVLQRF
jgi:hypothetical protein